MHSQRHIGMLRLSSYIRPTRFYALIRFSLHMSGNSMPSACTLRRPLRLYRRLQRRLQLLRLLLRHRQHLLSMSRLLEGMSESLRSQVEVEIRVVILSSVDVHREVENNS